MAISEDEVRNWERIREALEKADLTETFYYKRAVAITGGKPDPFLNLPQ